MRSEETAAETTVDVAIVGYGPVGQALAALLGRAGHRVAAFERFDEIYRLPRAVHLDHEIMRLLQSLDIVGELADELLPVSDYHWYGADGEPLMTLASPTPAPSGWEADYMFFQPALEAALDGAARACGTVTVERGWEAVSLADGPGGAELGLRRVADGAARTVRARWVVGADGANSFVRESQGIARDDLGFRERWLVVDVEPTDMTAVDLPPACQWCDPRRPTTHIQSGTRHRRWEFMLLPGEDAADYEGTDRVWELLAPWFSPGDGVLTRHAVYEFRSMLTDRMRAGHVLLVGDAAHLTPPFLGQGLCSGLRDAANVAWKLDLVLRGASPETLLDTVYAERRPQNEWIIMFAVELGKVLCQLDPEAAAERDATLRAAGPPPVLEFPPIAGALPGPLTGSVAVQGRVRAGAAEGLLDDVVGPGFTLIAAAGDPLAGLDDARREWLARVPVRAVSLDPAAPGGVADADGRLSAWLSGAGVHAALVRPDFYVLGTAGTPADVPALVAALQDHLTVTASTT